MAKITLTDVANLQNETTAVNAFTANNTVLETASDNTLSRDGTAPNQMQAVLDMNSNRIINLPAADTGNQPATKAQLDAIGNGYLGNNILTGVNNEINVSSGGGTTTFGLPSSITLTGKTLTNGAFAGTPTAPTASLGTNTTQLATTAFVQANAASAITATAPYTLAWEHGVPGNTGADMTVPLQALINSMSPQGGTLYIRGLVNSTFLDLTGKSNITIKGADQGTTTGAGYFYKAILQMNTGAVGVDSPAIKCWSTQNITFEDLTFYAPNPAFNGTLISWGSPVAIAGQDTFGPKMRNCTISTGTSTAAVGMSMHGSTNGSFRDVTFGGTGCLLKLQDNSFLLVSFVACHLFDTCSFLPSGITYTVQGSCGNCTFLNCLWEPGSDGQIWAIRTSSNRPFYGITLINPAFIDTYSIGSVCVECPWGNGLTVVGGTGGAPGGYIFSLGGGGISHGDPEVRGLVGVSISGFFANGIGQLVAFAGTKANKTNVRGVKVFGNSIINGALLAGNFYQAEHAEFSCNNTYGLPNDIGSDVFYPSPPTYADRTAAVVAGLTSGQMFMATGASNALQLV